MRLLLEIIKVISFTNCIPHSPSIFHTILHHLHPFPSSPIRQKAKKTKPNSRTFKPGKKGPLGFPGQQFGTGSPCCLARPCHFSPWPILSLSFPWCAVWVVIPFPIHLYIIFGIRAWSHLGLVLNSLIPNFHLLHFTNASQPLFFL